MTTLSRSVLSMEIKRAVGPPWLSSVLIVVVKACSRHKADTDVATLGMKTTADGSQRVPPSPARAGGALQ